MTSDRPPRITVVMPVYNEMATIEEVLLRELKPVLQQWSAAVGAESPEHVGPQNHPGKSWTSAQALLPCSFE